MKTAKLFLLPAFAFFTCTGLYAQVTIGGLTEPKPGAILDLNSNTGVKGGLLLSNVPLKNLYEIPHPPLYEAAYVFPNINGANYNETGVKSKFTGAMVYHTGENNIPAGVYLWNGENWSPAGYDCRMLHSDNLILTELSKASLDETLIFSVSGQAGGHCPDGETFTWSVTPSNGVVITPSSSGTTATATFSQNGNYTVTVTADNHYTPPGSASKSLNVFIEPITFSYNGTYQQFTATKTGNYEIELWGAAGGLVGYGINLNNYGAYTKGKIHLNEGDQLYIYVGGRGVDGTANSGRTGGAGGWNGGGKGGDECSSCSINNNGAGGGGGGATDVRLVSGSWNDANSLRSRIMVAGGAAGGTICSSCWGATLSATGSLNLPATQTSGNAFGLGGDGYRGSGRNTNNYDGGGAGGGGYWGGGGSDAIYHPNSNYTCENLGSGGSSYISGHIGSVAVISSASNAPRQSSTGTTCANGTSDIMCSYHYSGRRFTDTQMIAGNSTMPAANATDTGSITGKSGNGYARIHFWGE
jgi:hypothetical protein